MDPHQGFEGILDTLNTSGLEYDVCGGAEGYQGHQPGRPQDLVDIENRRKLKENE